MSDVLFVLLVGFVIGTVSGISAGRHWPHPGEACESCIGSAYPVTSAVITHGDSKIRLSLCAPCRAQAAIDSRGFLARLSGAVPDGRQ